MSVKTTNKSYVNEYLSIIRVLNSKHIEVGYFKDKETILMIANVNEYGADIEITPKMRAWFAYQGYPLKKSTTHIKIPERSFVRSSFDKYKEKINNFAMQQIDLLFERRININQFYVRVGEYCVGLIKEYMTDLRAPANSPLTVEMKGSSNPLIDTGLLRNSIEWRLV